MLYIHWILLVIYLAITIGGIVAVLMDNKQPEKTMAWILVLCFMPIVGIIFYLFFGQNTRKEKVISERSMDLLMKRSMLEFAEQENLHIPRRNRPLMKLFTNQNWALPFKDNEVSIFTDGYEIVSTLLYNRASPRPYSPRYLYHRGRPIGQSRGGCLDRQGSPGSGGSFAL